MITFTQLQLLPLASESHVNIRWLAEIGECNACKEYSPVWYDIA